jgi:hypothetical protein
MIRLSILKTSSSYTEDSGGGTNVVSGPPREKECTTECQKPALFSSAPARSPSATPAAAAARSRISRSA